MEFHYEIRNQKLKKMVEKQAKKFKMTTDELIYAYVKRGLMSDGINKEKFKELHSEEYLSEVNNALNVD